MRQVVLAVLGLAAAGAMVAQTGRTYASPGGFGNILYPGTGHAPNAPTGTPGFGSRFPGNFGNRGLYTGGYPAYAPRVNHPGHGRTTVVPYPVIVGGYGGYGYGGGFYDAPQQPPQGFQEGAPPIVNTNTAPSVVINQTFIPERAVPVVRDYSNGPEAPPQEQQSGLRVYEGLKTPRQPDPSARKSSDQPTLYLLAFKDHRIVPALGYWVEQGNLHYVSAEHTLNQASLDLIDRDMSQQLNDERNVEFKLPRLQ